DIQKLPVRGLLWVLFTHYELLIGEIIRAVRRIDANGVNAILEDYVGVQKEWSKRKASDFAIDEVAVATLHQKELILKRIVGELFADDSSATLSEMRALRNDLAHAHAFANSPQAARTAVQRLRLCQQWIETLNSKLIALRLQSA